MDTRTFTRLKFVCISLCCLCLPPPRSAALPLISVPSSLSTLSLLLVSLFVPPILCYSSHPSFSFFPQLFPSLLFTFSLIQSCCLYRISSFLSSSVTFKVPFSFYFYPFSFYPPQPFFKPEFSVLFSQIIRIVGQFCSSSSMQ